MEPLHGRGSSILRRGSFPGVERSPRVRADAALPFADLGLALDAEKNAAAVSGRGETEISAAGARVRTLVIEAREDLAVLAEMKRVLG